MSRILYCSEPIDRSDYGPWKESVAQVCGVAAERGWLVYRPSQAWRIHNNTPIGTEIEQVNRLVLESAGAVVAHLPSGVPTIGTPREIEWASSRDVPALVVTDIQSSWSLADVPSCQLGEVGVFNQWLDLAENRMWRAGAPAFGVGPRELHVVLDDAKAQLPTRSNSGDAGFDLYVSQDVKIKPGQFVDVPYGIRIALPYGVWGRITGRSSTLRKRSLLVAEGVIDTGYRGPIYSGVFNLSDCEAVVKAGDRIAQMVLHSNEAPRFGPVSTEPGFFDRIPGDSRGTSGFGSSGT